MWPTVCLKVSAGGWGFQRRFCRCLSIRADYDYGAGAGCDFSSDQSGFGKIKINDSFFPNSTNQLIIESTN
jgi:hypothetical protein